MTLEELRAIAASVGERRGWDFSRMRTERDPTPWEYVEVVRPYLHPSTSVLDIGTGGGEVLIKLAPHFGCGVGIDVDPAMVGAAQENTPPALQERVSFKVMDAAELQFPDECFDLVLNRHCTIHVEPIVRVLYPGGVFITQQVGRRNTRNILAAFAWGADSYGENWWQDLTEIAARFEESGCTIIARGEYDVCYWFSDLESFIFWLKAAPFPEEIDLERNWRRIDDVLARFHSARGIETNEHRELLIVRKRQESI